MSRSLPEVLAGPIVRRSTVDEVNVWLATSVALPDPELLLFDAESRAPITTDSTSRSVHLGLQLHVHMLTARPVRDMFVADTPIAYDIVSAGGRQLADMMNVRSIVLPGYDLPTFVLQLPGVGSLHALYGSCRKPHGPAPDLMRAADLVMRTVPHGRPEALFLGGDQIYADDVDGELLKEINTLSISLIGFPEVISGLPGHAQIPDANRGAFLKRRFTSGDMKHHLLTFGEYAAMYLFAWNPELWLRQGAANSAPTTRDAPQGANAARRVMANIVTYMTFDDHEITDDWFLNQRWRRRALQDSEWATQIIVNGLCAYWAFQGWGNEPQRYSDSFLRTMDAYARTRSSVDEARRHLLPAHGWSYVAPTSPPTLVLDTRTSRTSSAPLRDHRPPSSTLIYTVHGGPVPATEVPTTRDVDAPRLLNVTARLHLERLVRQLPAGPLVVVAPSPIFGFRPIEEAQELVGWASPPTGDLESWAANPRNTVDFVRLLLRTGHDQVVVLSGDVHYGFEMAVNVATRYSTLSVAQFCSSALKNRPDGTQGWFASYLRHTGDRDRAIAWWVFDKGDDGPITRYHALPASMAYDRLVRAHGNPSFVVTERLNNRDGGGVIVKNNLGEIVVDGSGVTNRFWLPEGRHRFEPTDATRWEHSAWPAPRVWPEALAGTRH